MMTLPKISILTTSYNTPIYLVKECFLSLESQSYPKKYIEHIVMDGGSTNGSLDIFAHYKTKIFVRKDLINNAQERTAIGIHKASGDILLILQPDNILTNKDWLLTMVKPFIENKKVFGAFSMHNDYQKDMTLLVKYCALVGSSDPVLYFMGRSDKVPRFSTKYDKGEVIKDCPNYTIIRFNRENFPTVGDNGHMMRLNIIKKYLTDPQRFIHVDFFYDLLKHGFDTYAIVKNSIIHHTGDSLIQLVKRKIKYKQYFFDSKSNTRKYFIVNKKDKNDQMKIVLFALYSMTLIGPLRFSIKGYKAEKSVAWLLHPIVCLIFLFSYGVSEIHLLSVGIFNFLKLHITKYLKIHI